MDPRRRRELTRYGAPAAFLAAVTVAVLLVKSGLSGNGSTETTALFSTPTRTTSTHRAVTTTRTIGAPTRYYTVQAGDTLGAIAAHENTTIEKLLSLNPGIDPKALHSGQRIRVG